jgi:AraC-like DNA-binding protein
MDVLSDLLQHLGLESDLLSLPRCFAPWGLFFAAGEEAVFHLILGGMACLRVAGQDDPLELHAGTFVLLPHGPAHSLADAPGSALRPAESAWAGKAPAEVAASRLGGQGRETLLVSGRYRFARHGVHALLSQLPPVLQVGCDEGWRGVPLEHGVQLLSAELASARPGSQAVTGRLLEVLFVQALRCAIEDGRGGPASWLQGLGDERIARALACIHGEPGQPWSTAALAERAGMSRAAFAARFAALVGEPPPHYLTRWRIQTALRALREPGCTLGQVAQAAGYPSTAAFTRIFKRMVGMPPAEYRRATAAGQEPLLEAQRRPGGPSAVYAAQRFSPP